MRRSLITAAVLLSMVTLGSRAADWEPPKNDLFTEKQVESYAAAQKELFQMMKAMGKAVEGSKSGVGAVAVLAGMDDKINAVLGKHGLQRAEYDWLSGKVSECAGVAMLDEIWDKGKEEMAGQAKKNAEEIAAAKKKVAEYEQALKDGKRVLTPERRAEVIKQAQEEQASAKEEVKQHEQEAKDIETEAKQHDTEAKEAEALAKNPPSDVDADGRADYIKGKQEEAANARNAAKETRERLKETDKQIAEAKAKTASFDARIKNPELPTTPDDKAQVKDENERGLANAKSDLETFTQATQFIKDGDANMQKQRDEMHKAIKEENLALVKKHLKEVREAWGTLEEKK